MEGSKVILTPGWFGLRVPRACIIGLGLIGGSWAGALYHAGWEVFAVDPEKASLEEAVNRGWLKDGWPTLPEVLEVDLVILALPLQILMRGLENLRGKIPRGAIVTDVGSIKMEICEKWLREAEKNPQDFYFIGGHPMSGSEQSGFEVADSELFRGYPYVLTPSADCPQMVVQKLVGLIQSFGANIVFREPANHDAEVAMVSHIPHLLAVALTLAAQESSHDGKSALALAGRSFRDLTRIADSSPDLWKEILVKNSEAILGGLTLWEQKIQKLRESLLQKDGETIAEAFRKAHLVRKEL